MSQLRKYRKERGLTQVELARKVGMSRGAYLALEAGESTAKVSTALLLARVLNTTVENLFGDDVGRDQHHLLLTAPLRRVLIGEVGGERIVREVGDLALSERLRPADGVLDSTETIVEQRSTSVFVTGCDPCVSLVVGHLAQSRAGVNFRWIGGANARARRELEHGMTHFAVIHGDSEAAASASVPNGDALGRLPLAQWSLVLAMAPHLSRGVSSLEDLVGRDLRWALREPGSGVRTFLDDWLLGRGLILGDVMGSSRQYEDHFDVASALSDGRADVGLTMGWVAAEYSLAMVEVGVQRSELWYRRDRVGSGDVDAIGSTLNSSGFQRELNALFGYRSLVG